VKELIRAGHDAGRGESPLLPTLDAFGVHKNDLLELLTELLLPWQENLYDDKIDSKTKATITRICNSHHMMLKSGAAHFRSAASASSAKTALVVPDERQDERASMDGEDEEDDGSEKAKTKDTDTLVKAAKVKAAPKAKSKQPPAKRIKK
jgi:hypothetical protein